MNLKDNGLRIRSRLVQALADRDGIDLATYRLADQIESQALALIESWSRHSGTPSSPVEHLCEEARLNAEAIEAERAARVEASAARTAAFIKAREPDPDPSHVTLALRDEATGKLYRVRLSADQVTLAGYRERETA